MAQAGTAFVDIEGRTDNLPQQILDALAGIDAAIAPEADTSTLTSDLEDAISAVDGTVTADVGADTGDAQAEIDALDGQTIEETVEVDTSGAQGNIDDLSGSIDALAGASGIGGGAAGGLSSELLGLTGVSGGTTAAIAALVGGLGFAVSEGSDAEVTLGQLDQMVINVGDNAGVSSQHLQELATGLQETAGFSDEAVMSGEALVLMFENVRNTANQPIFDRTIQSAADLARSPMFNGDIESAARTLGRALDDPTSGMGRLRRAGIQLTDAQQEQIRSLQESGQLEEAQAALLDIVDGKVGGLARRYGNEYAGGVDRAKEAVGEMAEGLGAEMLPALDAVSESVVDQVQRLNSWNDALNGALLSGPIQAILGVGDGISGVGTVIGDLPPALAEATSGTEAFGDAAGRAKEDVDGLSNTLHGYLDGTFAVPEAQRNLRDSFHDLFTTLLTEGHSADDVAASLEAIGYSTADLGAATGDFAGAADMTIGRLRGMYENGEITRAEFVNIRDAIRGAQDQGPLVTPVSTPGSEHANQQVDDLYAGLKVTGSARATPSVSVITERAQFDRLIRDLDAADNRRFAMQVSVNTVGGPRAAGGPVEAGVTYPVGEEGVELFTPASDGFIIPNHALESVAPAMTTPGGRAGPHAMQPVKIFLNDREVGQAMIPVIRELEREIR